MYKTLRLIAVLALVAVWAIVIRMWTTRQTLPPSAPAVTSGQSGTRLVMGTFANVTAVARDQDTITRAVTAAHDELDAVDDMMSDYKPDSELTLVNREAFDRPVPVSEPLFEVLQASLEYSIISEGAFDVTIGPVVQLWRDMQKQNSRPTDQQLAEARQKVGYRHLILDAENRTVRFARPGMKLDLGAIAKGYAIDRAIDAMKAAGAAGGLVDVGGDIRCFGLSPKLTNTWRIGLDDPDGDGDILLVLNLTDIAVATSGDYRRFVVIDDQRFSHIINPSTTASARDLTSVTIIAPTAMQADALATVVSVMGHEKGLALIESVDNTEAILIPAADPALFIKTKGADDYIR